MKTQLRINQLAVRPHVTGAACLLATGLLLANALSTSAAVKTWDGGGPDFNWSNATNWDADTAPAATGDSLVFAGLTGLLNTNNNAVTSLGSTSITFASGAGSFVLAGSPVTVGNSGANDNFITKASTADQTIALNVNLAGGQRDRTIILTGGGTLTLSGNVNFANDWLFPTTTAGTIVLSGNNSGDGKGGVLTSGSNSSRAAMRNNVGGTALVLGSDTALGNSGSGDVGAGTANFRGLVANQNMTISTINGNRNLSGSTIIINTANVTFNGTNNFTIGNLIVQGGNRDFWVASNGAVTVQNSLSLSSDQTGRQLYVNLTGAGGMVVNGPVYDTFHSGGVTSGASTLRKAGAGTMIVNGPINGANTALQVDAGTMILTSTNSYRGTTTIGGGKLVVSSAQLATNTITIASGATLEVNVSDGSQLQPGTLAAANSTLNLSNPTSLTTAPIQPGTMTLNGAVTVNINSTALAPGNSYPLVNWTSIGGTGGFVLGSCPLAASLSTNGNTLQLDVATVATNTWTGGTDGNWDTATANWTPANYSDGNFAAFDDTATGATNVIVNQVVKPGRVMVNNSSLEYFITSSGDNYIDGGGSLVKTGDGTLTLDGPNAYSGGTTLSAGQLNINYGGSNSTNSAIGSGTLTIGGGALDNTSAGDVSLLPAIAQVWSGDFSYVGSLHNLDLGNGAVMLSANRTVAVTNNTLAIGGVIGDGGVNYSLTKTGDGTLALSGANSFGGGLVLNAGRIKAGNASALGTGSSQLNGGVLDLDGSALANANNINNSAFVLTNSSASAAALAVNSTINADFTIGVGSGDISVARLIAGATRIVTKEGAGTLTFGGAGHNSLMGVVVNDGTLICGNNGGYSADRGFTLNAGTVKLAGAGSGGSSPNSDLINNTAAFTINGGVFDLNGWNETVAIVNGTAGVILNNATGSNRTLTIGSGDGTGSFAGSFQDGAGVLSLAKTGAGTQTLASTNTFSGSTLVNNGLLQAGRANAFSPNSDVTLLLGDTIGVLDLNGYDNAIGALNGAGTADTTSGSATVLTIGANGGSGNFSGALQNSSGALSLVKVGTGTQTLSGANNFSGATVVSNGVLAIGSSLNGSGAVVVYGPAVMNITNASPSIAGAVTLSGTNATLSLLDGTIGTLYLNSGLTLNNSNVLEFDIGGGGMDSVSMSGSFAQSGKTVIKINSISAPGVGTYPLISGAAGINSANFVLGNGLSGYTLALSSDATTLYLNVALNAPATAYWHNRTGTAWNGGGSGSYNWDTDQSSGTVVATLPSASSDVYFAADGASSYSTTLGANFDVKSLTFNTAGSVTITGANTLTLGGSITVNSGAAANNTISAASLVLGTDQNLNVADAASTLVISSPISGSHALNVNAAYGSGTLALSGSSTYSGSTTITYGTLALENPTNTLPDNSAVTINNGAMLNLGANNDTVGAVTLASGTISGSSGVLTGSAYNVQGGTVAANLGGSAAMTMTGSSVLLASNSTYTGGTTISSGTIQIGASNALGSGAVSMANGTYLDLNGQTIGNTITVNGAATWQNNSAIAAAVTANASLYNNLTIDTTGGDIAAARLIGNTARTVLKTGGHTLTLDGAGHNNLVKLQVQGGTVLCANNGGYTADRGFELDYGTVKLAGPGSGGAYPNANLFNDGQPFWMLGTPGTFDLNGWNETVATVYGVGGTVIENTAVGTNSTLTLGADNGADNNTFSGTMQDGGGVLAITKAGSGIQILNGASTYSGNTTINGGQLQVTASGASPNSTFVVNTNGGLAFASDTAFQLGGLSGPGDVSLLNDGSSPVALTVGGNNVSTTYSGALLDGGAGATVVKVGTGTLILSGTNHYSGLTTVSNGALVISPNYVAGGNFTIEAGAVFGVAGNTPATSAQIGTLTPGASGPGSSTLLFTSLPVPTNAPMTVATLAPAGGAGSVIISNTAALEVGTYNLINYTTLSGAGFSAFALAPLPPGTTANLVNDTAATPKVIQLVVTAVASQVWSGGVNTNWDIAATLNWKLDGVTTNYHDASPVLFDDTVGGGQTTVNLATNVQPNSVTVSNSTKDFTFTTANGSGINAFDGFVKDGSGTLTLVNLTNNFTGAIAINAGAVVLSASTFGGSDITNNGSLVYSNGIPVVNVAVSGGGTLVQSGTNTLELASTNNTYSGGTIIKSGIVQSDNASSLGVGTVTLGDGVSASSATLQAVPNSANLNNSNAITVAAGGTGILAIQNLGGRDYNLYGNIALNNALTLKATASGALFVRGSIVSGGSNPTLTIGGGGAVNKFVGLYGDNSSTFTGNIIITNGGDLKTGFANALSAINPVALDATSAFDNGSLDQIIAGLNDFGGGGGAVAAAGSGKFITLGGSGSYSFSGVINNTGGIIKAGSGQQILSGANTYSGLTIVSNGTLLVNGSLAAGPITVAGGILGGAGVIGGAVTNNATLSPGAGIGTLTINGNITLNTGSTNLFDVDASGLCDVIAAGANVTYGGVLKVVPTGAFSVGQQFQLFSGAGATNASNFASIEGNPGGGNMFSFTNGVLSVVSTGSSGAIITNSYVGGVLSLTWPPGQGWALECQTNDLSSGLKTGSGAWSPVTTSDGSYSLTVDQAQPTVFYRLKK